MFWLRTIGTPPQARRGRRIFQHPSRDAWQQSYRICWLRPFLPIFPEGLSFLIDFKREITGHDDRGLETLVYAAEEATVGAVATVTNVGKALGIDVLAPRRRSVA